VINRSGAWQLTTDRLVMEDRYSRDVHPLIRVTDEEVVVRLGPPQVPVEGRLRRCSKALTSKVKGSLGYK